MLQGILLEIDTENKQGKIEQAVNRRQYLFNLDLWEGKANELCKNAEIEFDVEKARVIKIRPKPKPIDPNEIPVTKSAQECIKSRNADAECRAATLQTVIDFDGAVVNVNDAFHDGKTQTGPRGFGAECTVEAVKDAGAFFGSNPRPVVADFDDRAIAFGMRANFNAAAFGRIAHGVVREIGHHQTNGVFHPFRGGGKGFGAHRNVLLVCNGRHVFANACGQRFQPHRGDRALAGFGIESGQREKLLNETRGTVDAVVEAHETLLLGFGRFGTLSKLHLQLDGRERRTKLVSRVGRKALLCGQAFAQTVEQVIDGAHESLQFQREAFGGNRFERGRRTAGHRSGRAFKRRQTVTYDDPDGNGNEGQQQAERLQNAEGRGGREFGSHRHVLTDRDDERACGHRIRAPVRAVELFKGKTGAVRQRQALFALALPDTVGGGVVNLDDDLIGLCVAHDGEMTRVADRHGMHDRLTE